MESYEEPDSSATFISAQAISSSTSKSTKSIPFTAATSSHTSSKYQQELNRLLYLQSQLLNPSFKVLIPQPTKPSLASSALYLI